MKKEGSDKTDIFYRASKKTVNGLAAIGIAAGLFIAFAVIATIYGLLTGNINMGNLIALIWNIK
jgi:hypothetical protein